MTTLNPPIPLEPMPAPRGQPVDDFVHRLSHPRPGHASGAFVTLIQTLLSFGMLPLVLWPMRWAEFTEGERHDLIDLAGWWRRRVDADDAAKLDKIVKRLHPRPILMVLPWLAVSFNVVFMIGLMAMGDDIARLFDLTFDHRHRVFGFPGLSPLADMESHLYTAWVITLGVAYACQWFAVRSHVATVGRLVQWTNRLARENRFVQVKAEVLQAGMNPLWILMAVGLSIDKAWWAIPMVLAGAAQRAYTRKSSPAVRIALASQARNGFAVGQSRRERFCPTGHCGARLPSPARFCPRCGTAV